MSRTSYDAAFQLIKSQNDACVKLDELGCRFEYDDGPLGKFMQSLINNSEAIIIDALGLHEVSHNITCRINNLPYPTTLEVLYTEETNSDWSITLDDFCDFIYEATKSTEIQDLMWKTMVEKDEAAKKALNEQIGNKIGAVVKYLNR